MSLSNSRLFDPNLNNRVVFGTPGPQGPQGPVGPPGPGSSPMTPFVEGTAFGETSTGRTLLGYGVDSSSNNIGLWCSSTGSPQPVSNSSSSVTAFFDTNVASTTMLNGIFIGDGGSINGTNFSNSIFLERDSTLTSLNDWTENTIMLNKFTANGGDEITSSVALISGQFVTDSQFDKSILIGDMTRAGGIGVSDCILIRTPDPFGTLTMASDSCVISNGQSTEVLSPGDFMCETFNKYYLKTLSPGTGGESEYVTYDSFTGEMTASPIPGVYSLPVKQPTSLGGQFGISSLGNASDVNGRNSFNNYSAGPVQLTGVSSVGSSQYQTNTPAATSFTNDIFLGRTHSFNNVQSISNSLIAANIVTGANISQINDCNIIVPRAGSLTFPYVGSITGASFHSSGAVNCAQDPLYSTVHSSGGSVQPGSSNLVLSANQGAGSIIMNGSSNILLQSSGSSVTYPWPVGVSNTTVINNGAAVVLPTANNQLCTNSSSFLYPNLPAGTLNANTYPVAFDVGTGLITQVQSLSFARSLTRKSTTNGSGQIAFSVAPIVPNVNTTFTLTIQDASTVVSYNAQIISVVGSTVNVQCFNSTVIVLGGNSMVPSGAGITVFLQMNY